MIRESKEGDKARMEVLGVGGCNWTIAYCLSARAHGLGPGRTHVLSKKYTGSSAEYPRLNMQGG